MKSSPVPAESVAEARVRAALCVQAATDGDPSLLDRLILTARIAEKLVAGDRALRRRVTAARRLLA